METPTGQLPETARRAPPGVITAAGLEGLMRRVVREELARAGRLLAAAAMPDEPPAGASGLTLSTYVALDIPQLFDRIAATTSPAVLADLAALERGRRVPRPNVITAIDVRREELEGAGISA